MRPNQHSVVVGVSDSLHALLLVDAVVIVAIEEHSRLAVVLVEQVDEVVLRADAAVVECDGEVVVAVLDESQGLACEWCGSAARNKRCDKCCEHCV